MKKLSKTQKVKNHLINKGNITSWEAITQYRATRLSDIIFKLKKNDWIIETVMLDGQDSRFAKYVLIAKPE